MAKFYGEIGYVTTDETQPGKWTKVVTGKKYSGDYERVFKSWQNGSKVNDDITISAQISVIADPFFKDHMHEIRYVKVNGVPWEVSSVEPRPPRFFLTLGGVYNGEVAGEE